MIIICYIITFTIIIFIIGLIISLFAFSNIILFFRVIYYLISN
jgi:hypothetical protein